MKNVTISIHKKAKFEYELLKEFVCGIVLTGSEVKSACINRLDLTDSYAGFDSKGELFLNNINIPLYKNSSYNNHVPVHPRKLLLTKKECIELRNESKKQGLALIATKMYFNGKGKIKVQLYLAKGKNIHDKRASIKQRENDLYERRVKKGIID